MSILAPDRLCSSVDIGCALATQSCRSLSQELCSPAIGRRKAGQFAWPLDCVCHEQSTVAPHWRQRRVISIGELQVDKSELKRLFDLTFGANIRMTLQVRSGALVFARKRSSAHVVSSAGLYQNDAERFRRRIQVATRAAQGSFAWSCLRNRDALAVFLRDRDEHRSTHDVSSAGVG